MKETVMLGLKIMGYGMAGIFVAAVVIIACVWLLQVSDKLGAKKETKGEQTIPCNLKRLTIQTQKNLENSRFADESGCF